MGAGDADGTSEGNGDGHGDGDWVDLTVRANRGGVQDPRELKTILICSLRELYGDLEPHSSNVRRVAAAASAALAPLSSASNARDLHDRNHHYQQPHPHPQHPAAHCFLLTCRKESAAAVRAALTLVTPPPYLEGTLYRFDVLGAESARRRSR